MKKLLALVLIIMATITCAGANAHSVRGIELIEDDRINTNQFIESESGRCSACIEISDAYYIWARERIDEDNHIVRITMYTMNGDELFDQDGYDNYEDYVLQVNTLIQMALNAIDDGLV